MTPAKWKRMQQRTGWPFGQAVTVVGGLVLIGLWGAFFGGRL